MLASVEPLDPATESWVPPAWTPPPESASLADRLRRCLEGGDAQDLLVFGSQARGTTTGFSDVDAIIVISDEAASSSSGIRRLQPKILAAQRAVQAHQPMQHHGFEVVPRSFLARLDTTLPLPAVALRDVRSAMGSDLLVSVVGGVQPGESARQLEKLARSLRRPAWPRHAWDTHVMISEFELLPVLYLQARGAEVPKWASFDEVRQAFPDRWGAYDALAEIRDIWPRTRQRGLTATAATLRNPWSALALWRRSPVPIPSTVRSLLTDRLLDDLSRLAADMALAAA